LPFSYRYRHRFGQVPFILIVHAHAGHTSAGVRARSLRRPAEGNSAEQTILLKQLEIS
jgi:hypothetical protein